MPNNQDVKNLLDRMLNGKDEKAKEKAYRDFCLIRLHPEITWSLADTLAYICDSFRSISGCYPEMLIELGVFLSYTPTILLSENGKKFTSLLKTAAYNQNYGAQFSLLVFIRSLPEKIKSELFNKDECKNLLNEIKKVITQPQKDKHAWFLTGYIYFHNIVPIKNAGRKAIACWEQADAHAEANVYLGNIYVREIPSIALFRYSKAMALGSASAMFFLGARHEDRSLRKNLDQNTLNFDIENYYRQAAKLGFAPAITNLGYVCLKQGRYIEAKNYFTQAIELGNINAMLNLSWMYLNNFMSDVPKNLGVMQAYTYVHKAEAGAPDQSESEAIAKLKTEIEKKMITSRVTTSTSQTYQSSTTTSSTSSTMSQPSLPPSRPTFAHYPNHLITPTLSILPNASHFPYDLAPSRTVPTTLPQFLAGANFFPQPAMPSKNDASINRKDSRTVEIDLESNITAIPNKPSQHNRTIERRSFRISDIIDPLTSETIAVLDTSSQTSSKKLETTTTQLTAEQPSKTATLSEELRKKTEDLETMQKLLAEKQKLLQTEREILEKRRELANFAAQNLQLQRSIEEHENFYMQGHYTFFPPSPTVHTTRTPASTSTPDSASPNKRKVGTIAFEEDTSTEVPNLRRPRNI